MILISLTYVAPMDAVEKHFDGHIEWLNRHYADGVFVASGRKVPRTGGLIIARGSLDEVRALCEADPFVSEGVARYELTEVDFSRTVAGVEGLKQP
ncbi:YciI family protein [Martelella sp. AD-3]|uniref:YciI family protein n=1 Tax=Martelella sp. AD-3 TaxID=686597 RepID=UPI000467DCC7|nr:YciI family protein [Martelella sp. AD-3]AMM86974.1 GTP cyclohydrolase [Martelella sp. AD-3]MAM13441.1 GTP cyclohydrolase [Rhizobiaceae bacterium]